MSPVVAILPVFISFELLGPWLGESLAGQRSPGHARVYALLVNQKKLCNPHLLCCAGVLVAPQGMAFLPLWCAHHKSCNMLDANSVS